MNTPRRTIITQSGLARRSYQLAAARAGRQGVQVIGLEQLAARLTGGFARPVDGDDLKEAIRSVIRTVDLGELEAIRDLPGLSGAAARTLRRAWLAGIDLQKRGADHPRFRALANLEQAALRVLPGGMLPPPTLARRAAARSEYAPAITGAIEVRGLTDLDPVWKPLLESLAEHVEVTWFAAPDQMPEWLEKTRIKAVTGIRHGPKLSGNSAGTALGEVQDAMRWARQLLVNGVDAGDIAIAATATGDYDSHMLTARHDADFDVHFAHGIPVTATPAGQAAAALADILARGCTSVRLERLHAHLGSHLFPELPADWIRKLPDAPLSTAETWDLWLTQLENQGLTVEASQLEALHESASLLIRGTVAAETAGNHFLNGDPLKIWHRALLRGPAAAIDHTIAHLSVQDEIEATSSVAWLPASMLQAAPRAHTRLLGLNSSRWPRRSSEDPLLPDHVIPARELDPLPGPRADRLHFDAIVAGTETELVLSWSRRSAEGRRLARSPLIPAGLSVTRTHRHDVPAHAYSEADRLIARRDDFAGSKHALAATAKWRAWSAFDLGAHDGLIRPDHPVIVRILGRRHSATSLKSLLRHPLAFVWSYGLNVSTPEVSQTDLLLGGSDYGLLVHELAQRTTLGLAASGGLLNCTPEVVGEALREHASLLAEDWQTTRAVPPRRLFDRQLDQACSSLEVFLAAENTDFTGGASYAEVPFGNPDASSHGELPWDSGTVVRMPGTDLEIGGFIDHMNVSADGLRVQVLDFKTGKPLPKLDERIFSGGNELQRTIYAGAVRALFGKDIVVDAGLAYTRTGELFSLADPEAALKSLAGYLRAAIESLRAGNALSGEGASDTYDTLKLALPAARNQYMARKQQAVHERLPVHSQLWSES